MGTQGQYVIYQSKSKGVVRILVALGFLAFSLLALATPFAPDEEGSVARLAHWLAAYAGPPVMLGFLIWSVLQFVSPRPILVVNEQGIETSVAGIGLVKWAEIADVRHVDLMGKPFLGIVARDVEALASRYSGYKATTLRFNQKNSGAAVGVSEEMLPMKVEALLGQIGDYCRAKIREHSPAP
jgi:hypothetical protein